GDVVAVPIRRGGRWATRLMGAVGSFGSGSRGGIERAAATRRTPGRCRDGQRAGKLRGGSPALLQGVGFVSWRLHVIRAQVFAGSSGPCLGQFRSAVLAGGGFG